MEGCHVAYRIVVDVSERKLRLYDDQKLIKTYPVGVGKIVSKTPTGDYLIVNKEPNPGGPYGAYWMGLSKRHYGIHGTNRPSSIGKMVSKGCIRMYNKDVIELVNTVPLGTHVSIRP
jgi:lipoprotein-anchoring transpeptidase ErfK/SrfK